MRTLYAKIGIIAMFLIHCSISSLYSQCNPTVVVPYTQVNGGIWSQTTSASLAAGGTVIFGPQPFDGSWSWSGPNGFTANTREATITNVTTAKAGNYVLTYTNTCGARSTVTFTIAVSSSNIIWSDEFDGSSVNTSKWNIETVYYNGGGGELEYYLPQNVTVSGGYLNITAKKENYGGAAYTSGRMNTFGKYSLTYGNIKCRAKIPMGQGLWPAIWMLGNSIGSAGWPACGEIDIMEHINSVGFTNCAMHWALNGAHTSQGGTYNTTPGNWHEYSINWNSSSIKYYVDGANFFTGNIANGVNSTQAFHKPFYFLLNLAVGGNWPGPPNSSTIFPSTFQVDYLRVSSATAGAKLISEADYPEMNKGIDMYPNPLTDGKLNIRINNFDAQSPAWVSVFDLSGKLVLKQLLTGSQSAISSENELKRGLYSVKVENGINVYAKKIIVK